MSIKKEVQGNNGYLKILREKCLPDTKRMAELAFELYKSQTNDELTAEYVKENTDKVLRGLFTAETTLYNEKSSEIVTRVVPYYYNLLYKENPQQYPETTEKIKALFDVYEKAKKGKRAYPFDDFIVDVSDIIAPIVDYASFSQKQSAKVRVGESLQNHLSKIFEICHIPNDTQQQRIEGGTYMDFIIPHKGAIDERPDQVINIECQTTLKDRFRLTTGKSTDAQIKRYLATVTGAGIVTDKDIQDITVQKLKEIIINNNVTLVVLSDVKDEILLNLSEINQKCESGEISLEPEVSMTDMNRLVSLSAQKIISYKEMINRDVASLGVYWGF